MHILLHSLPPTLQQATTNPCLYWRLLDTHRKVWVSLLWGHFLLGPGAHKILSVPSKSLFPRPVWVLMALLWVNGDLLHECLCHNQVCCTQSPAPAAVHVSPQETLKHSSVSVSVGSLGLVCTRFVWALWATMMGMGFNSKCDFTPPTILPGLLCPWTWGTSS